MFQEKRTPQQMFFSRLVSNPTEKKLLNIREDIPTNPIEVNCEPTGIAQEEPIFFDADHQQTTENEL